MNTYIILSYLVSAATANSIPLMYFNKVLVLQDEETSLEQLTAEAQIQDEAMFTFTSLEVQVPILIVLTAVLILLLLAYRIVNDKSQPASRTSSVLTISEAVSCGDVTNTDDNVSNTYYGVSRIDDHVTNTYDDVSTTDDCDYKIYDDIECHNSLDNLLVLNSSDAQQHSDLYFATAV